MTTNSSARLKCSSALCFCHSIVVLFRSMLKDQGLELFRQVPHKCIMWWWCYMNNKYLIMQYNSKKRSNNWSVTVQFSGAMCCVVLLSSGAFYTFMVVRFCSVSF